MKSEREILEQVAAGTLSPEDAAQLLDRPAPEPVRERAHDPGRSFDLGSVGSIADELREVGRHLRDEVARELRQAGRDVRREVGGRPAREHPGDPAPDPSIEPVVFDGAITALRLVGAFRTTTIIGDPTVHTVSIEGPHRAHLNGATLVIDGDEQSIEGFRFESSRGARRSRQFRLGVDNPRPVPLRVRANPSLAITAEVAAGALKIVEMHDAITADVSAGALSIVGARGPLKLSTAAGPIKVQAKLTDGEHAIRCEAGAVKLILDPDSDVRITARASLGKVILPGVVGPSGFSIGSSDADATIGEGNATLAIDCAVGGVKVMLDGDEG